MDFRYRILGTKAGGGRVIIYADSRAKHVSRERVFAGASLPGGDDPVAQVAVEAFLGSGTTSGIVRMTVIPD